MTTKKSKRDLELENAELRGRVKALEEIVAMYRADRVPAPALPAVDVKTAYGTAGCVDGRGHEFPAVWHSTVPPACLKCGTKAFSTTTFTSCAIPNDGEPHLGAEMAGGTWIGDPHFGGPFGTAGRASGSH